ncbi:DinB family protein [Streptomyces sp. S1D4-11]
MGRRDAAPTGPQPTNPPGGLGRSPLVQHLAEVERSWFQRVFGDSGLPPVHEEETGYVLAPERGLDEALTVWRREVARGQEVCAGRSLEEHGRIPEGPMGGLEISLRWVYVHMIEEYARHNGHADIVRERIDGLAGA